MGLLARDELPFPHALREFQRLFPDEAACAAYLERARWSDGFICSSCGVGDAPRYVSTRPGVLRCRHCRRDTSLTAGTVMERTHTPLSAWFWAAYLLASQTPGMSAVQFQRQLGLSRYERAFQILHKLRAGMVRPDQDRIGGKPDEHVKADETWIGGRTRGERVEAFTTRAWWLLRSRSASASPPPSSIREGAVATLAASGLPWFQSAAPVRWVAS